MLTEKQLTDIYERELENAKRNFHAALDEYCAALNYEAFLWAYALGYEAGKKEA